MNVITEAVRVVGANKARLAFLAPLLTAVGAAVASWVVSGAFDAAEIRAAAGGAVLALVASAAAYLAPAGEVVVDSAAVQREVTAARGEYGAHEAGSR